MNRELEQIVAEVNKVVKGKDRVIRKEPAVVGLWRLFFLAVYCKIRIIMAMVSMILHMDKM